MLALGALKREQARSDGTLDDLIFASFGIRMQDVFEPTLRSVLHDTLFPSRRTSNFSLIGSCGRCGRSTSPISSTLFPPVRACPCGNLQNRSNRSRDPALGLATSSSTE